MNHRTSLVLLVLVSVVFARSANAEATPPNIVVILTDDQGYADLGCFGSKTIRTPNIDRMAIEGARLTSFYAAAPICTPTRAALMTGCYASRVGLSTPLHVYDHVGLNESEFTLPEMLRRAGYYTACIGKWHLGHLPQHYPTRHGFDRYFGTPLGHMFDRPAVGKAVGDTSDLFLDNEQPIPFPDHADLTERLTEQAVAVIRENRDRPFFLYLAHPMPHEPLAVSRRFANRGKGGLYGDVIEAIDWSTGKLLDAVKKYGLAKKTIIVFTSDNGPKKGHGSASPLRGFKHQPYEGGVRVPCVVWAPGRIPAGREIGSIISIMDLYPTCAEWANAETEAVAKQAVDGQSMLPLLMRNQAEQSSRREFFYFVRHGVLVGIRRGRWKLLLQQTKSKDGRSKPTTPELYDLVADIGESRNVAETHPKIVARLRTRIMQFEQEVQRTSRSPTGEYRSSPKP